MNRRTVLKAGVALAATSHTAIAAGDVPAAATLASMIDSYGSLTAARKALWDFVDAALDHEDTPPTAWIKMSELSSDHRSVLGDSRALHWADQIDADIDQKIAIARSHLNAGISKKHHVLKIARLEADRPKAHAILEGRARTYVAWRQASGVSAADVEAERLCDEIDTIERLIIERQAATLHEALLKADWLASNWKSFSDVTRLEAVQLLVTGRISG